METLSGLFPFPLTPPNDRFIKAIPPPCHDHTSKHANMYIQTFISIYFKVCLYFMLFHD
jgi:hypothetical protein